MRFPFHFRGFQGRAPARREDISAPQTEPEVADPEAWPIPGEAFPVHIVGEHGAVRLEAGRLSVATEGGAPRAIRLDDVAALFVHGNTSVSTPALLALMRRGVPVLWHGFDGRLVGQTLGLSGQPTAVREGQYAAAAHPGRTLKIARALAEAKVANSRRLLIRRLGAQDETVRQLMRLGRHLTFAADLDSLRGFEGAAGAAYFQAWPRLIDPARPHLRFERRSRRPPADPANAAISYLYAVLHGHCVAAAVAAGLDPMAGFLHARRPGRAALALDLMEPFRSLIVDASLIAAFNNGEFPPEAFSQGETREAGCLLTAVGRRAALAAFERRLAQGGSAPGPAGRLSYREAISRQARDLARSLTNGSDFVAFEPLR
jgi:CRISPR-associated exonuclease Cas4/CRISPR-associated protein Cas1